jgi:hypothetical protein
MADLDERFIDGDDGGSLSLLASGGRLYVACDKGHAWALTATPLEDRAALAREIPSDSPSHQFFIERGLL